MGLVIRLMLVLCLIKLHGVQVTQGNAVYQSDRHLTSAYSRKAVEDTHRISRVKRGWVSVIVYTAGLTTKATALGVNLHSILSEGCSIRKSICEDRDAIEKADKEIQDLKKKYDTKYLESKQDYLNLRESSTNNAYIEHYIKEAVSSIDDMANISAAGYESLQKLIPDVFKKYDENQNTTAEQYLKTIYGQLEVSLSDIKDMIKKTIHDQVVELAVQAVVEELLRTFAHSFDQTRDKLIAQEKAKSGTLSAWVSVDPEEAAIILDKDHPRHDEVLKKHGLAGQPVDSAFKKELKLTGKTFGVMLSDTKKYFGDKVQAIKDIDWKKIEVWNGIKRGVQHTYEGLSNKVQNMKRFVLDSEYRKFSVNNFKIGWTEGLVTAIGIIIDIVEIASINKNWNKVADNIKEARTKYEEYLANLKKEMTTLEEEILKFEDSWANVTDTFKDLSAYFKAIVESSNSDFNGVFGIAGQPDYSSSPIFSINFDNIKKDNVMSNQKSVISFIKDVDKKLTDINDELRARNILYESVAGKTQQSNPVNSIYNSLKSNYALSHLPVLKRYGESLKKKDVVCSIAKIRIDITEYDFFSLPPFRPRCELSDAEYGNIEKTATDQRNLEVMRTTVKQQIDYHNQITITDLLRAVQNAYSKIGMSSFGSNVNEKDIVCTVAEKFPDKQTYRYYTLSQFRPSCSAVDDAAFQQMKEQASKRQSLESDVRSALTTCDTLNFCPCPTKMAETLKASTADIIVVIKELQPSRKKYCGTTGCECVNL